ncbi:MAG: molybdate ABC transporter substrate-binding protein [Chloroflexi bacterium]|nr:molybdate ABC transporter substrate-binding protein [Chloroflexota bacterium]
MLARSRLFVALMALALMAACTSPSASQPAAPPTSAAASAPTTAPALAPTSAPVAANPTVNAPALAATTAPAAAPTAPAAAPGTAPGIAPTTAPRTDAPAKPTAAPAAQPTTAGSAPKPAAAPVSGEIVVFAAASLTDVFQDMATAFQQANPDAKLTFNFGASSTLATQLGQGASADVFASADPIQMDNARKSRAVTGQDQVFAGNRLVLITPRDNPANITSVKDLANDGVKFVTAQPAVPIGTYTSQMLDKASADPSYSSDFKERVMANTVSQETDVRQVVSKVQLGEADAAIVYSTDPTPQVRDQLNIIQVPDALQTLATYPIAVAKGNNSSGGEAFVSYVLGPEGQAALAKWGFLPAPQASASAQPTAATAGQPPAAGGAPSAGAPAASAPIPSVASTTFAPEVAVSGLVGNPRSFSMDGLKQLLSETVDVSFEAGQGTTTASFTGTRLLNVFEAAGGPRLPNDMNNAKLRTTVMVTGADGYQVALGWGELDPEFGAAPIMLAYLQDGKPMGDKQGMARLVVPGDKRGGRYVSTVKGIDIRDPGPAQP